MITILGPREGTLCNGLSRRSFLKIGALSAGAGGMMGNLTLPRLLQAEAQSGSGRSRKAIIMIYLPGGPPHQDLFDIKSDAPVEVRGEFKAMETRVSGIQISEQLPRLARIMDKLAIIRTVVGAKDRHESFQCLTGRLNDNQPIGGWPEIGSVLSKIRGSIDPALPAYVNLSPRMQHQPYNFGKPGYLGVAHAPIRPEGEFKDDMVLKDITLDRLSNRRALLTSLDRLRREVDSGGAIEGFDTFQKQAFEILTSSKLVEALDISREDPRVRERYGYGTAQAQGDAAPRLMEQFLAARRLVEAGVRCVTVSFSFWDWHGGAMQNAKANFPPFDQGVSALVEDLHARGLDKDVTVIAWGEFGRTPRINKDGGRDHWPPVSCALLAGGGMRTGQAIGVTTRHAEEPLERPVHFQEVFATLYHNLGIDTSATTLPDFSGRPHYLVENHQAISELV